jgi:hypothetical protein
MKSTHLPRVIGFHAFVRCFFESTRIHGMFSKQQLFFFPSSDDDLPRISDNNIITTIHYKERNVNFRQKIDGQERGRTARIIDRLMFAH